MLLKRDLTQVIRDFSQYLYRQQQMGNYCLAISEKSKDLMNKWGEKRQIQAPFLFQGSETSDIFIIDSQNCFFEGSGGELLIKILKAMHLLPESVFICNASDLKKIHAKIKAVAPEVIITLGTKAGQSLLKINRPLEQFRGKIHDYHGMKVMPTFHPSRLLKQPQLKRKVWEDMKLVMKLSGLKHGS